MCRLIHKIPRKARKTYLCFRCGKPINKGDKYSRQTHFVKILGSIITQQCICKECESWESRSSN